MQNAADGAQVPGTMDTHRPMLWTGTTLAGRAETLLVERAAEEGFDCIFNTIFLVMLG
jgi:hypothetical protein